MQDGPMGSRFHVHGLSVSVASNWPRLLDLVSMTFRAFPLEEKAVESLRVTVDRTKKPLFGTSVDSQNPSDSEDKWGTREFREGDVVRFRDGPVSVEFRSGGESRVNASFRVDRRGRIASAFKEVPSWEVCQSVMRLALHKPMLYLLERRGIRLLHGAAVSGRDGALLLLGLNGSGKSSLCHKMLDRYSYMADNFVLWDGHDVLGFPEPIWREVPETPAERTRPRIYGRTVLPVDSARVVMRAPLAAVLILSQGTSTRLTELPQDEAIRRISAIHDMTHQFPRHSYVGLLCTPDDGSWLGGLVRSAPCFALRARRPDEAIRALLDVREGTPPK